MKRQRIISLVDGFNLYHAISALHRPELKWVDLRALSTVFLMSYSEELTNVYYFSAYADHVSQEKQDAQKAYIQAIEMSGAIPVLGQFKKKNRKCPACDHKWIGHEEKVTDVNIALFLLNLAYQDKFDRALVVSNDSDLAPAIRMVRKYFPQKRITSVASPGFYHSRELLKASSDKTKIRTEHLERALLPAVVSNAIGSTSISRPHEYSSFSARI